MRRICHLVVSAVFLIAGSALLLCPAHADAQALPSGASQPTSTDPNLASQSALPHEDVVQLRYATLPAPLGAIAVHYWFVAFDARENTWSRWEVWQEANVAPTSWGHIQKDLMPPDSGVGGSSYRTGMEWRGQQAAKIVEVLRRPLDYPYRNSYRAWPGPNSNTYPAWVLRKAEIPVALDPKAIGKDFCGVIGGGVSETRSGFHADTPVVGLTLGAKDGIEIHVLCLTFGIDLLRPAIKTPFGRLGLPSARHRKPKPTPDNDHALCTGGHYAAVPA